MLKSYLQYFGLLTDDEIDNLISLSRKRHLEKTDYFVRQGEVCKEVAFILKGSLRSFYISDKGEEVTYCLLFPNNFITAYSSYITGQSTVENMQAITPVEILVISKEDIDALATKSVNLVYFLKTIAEQQYIELEKRIFQLQNNNALERYENLIKTHPEYVLQIPLQYLASYLGITQRHLSRIRKQFSLLDKCPV
ncbi:Crp/Fnr family transcriptional regulator [Flavobacterium sp.]|uniref:Crp/Fnr family transcriptional regulator n=1 Tax=Flavobacterium sp. TaxID=239 RepID=UPI003C676332